MRTLRHDLRNHLSTALGLLEQGEGEKARQYLLELTDSQAMQSSRCICENEIVNAVMSFKAEEMERRGILADLQIALPADLSIADTDLCALFGNALDNAIEAAQNTEERKIKVRCKAERGLFMLRVENSRSGQVQEDLRTTKADKKFHGFGLAGMREMVTRYDGCLEAGAKDGSFELVVSIPLGQNQCGRGEGQR